MRTFIAIELPTLIKKQLGDIARQLSRCDIAAAWVKSGNLHLTLKFLGAIDDTLVPQLAEHISQLAKEHSSFNARLNGFDFFPSPKRPLILYAAFQEPEPFKQLAQHLDRLLEPLGFAPEQHFTPHITLARIKNSKNLPVLQQLLEGITLQNSFSVNAVSLFSSTLHADGARYHVLQRGLLRESDK